MRAAGREQQLDRARGLLLGDARGHGLAVDEERDEEDRHAQTEHGLVALRIGRPRPEGVDRASDAGERLERLLPRQTGRLETRQLSTQPSPAGRRRPQEVERSSLTNPRPSTDRDVEITLAQGALGGRPVAQAVDARLTAVGLLVEPQRRRQRNGAGPHKAEVVRGRALV